MSMILFNKKSFTQIDQSLAEDYKPNSYMTILFLLILFFTSQSIAAFLILFYPETKGYSVNQSINWISHSIIANFFYILLTEFIVISSIIIYLKQHKVNLRLVGIRKFQYLDILYALTALPIFYITYVLIVDILTSLNINLNISAKQHLGFNSAIVSGNSEYIILTFISLVILPPIAEELMFRGLLLTSFRKILPLFFASFLTSLLFCLPHLFEGGNSGLLWTAALETFLLSFFLIYLRLKTDGIYASIFLHSFINLLAFISLYFLRV